MNQEKTFRSYIVGMFTGIFFAGILIFTEPIGNKVVEIVVGVLLGVIIYVVSLFVLEKVND